MSDRTFSILKWMWLTASGFCLILPVFFPSYPNPHSVLDDPIGTSTGVMFLLSFPLSLLGVPAMVFVREMLGGWVYTIQGMYLNVLFLFALGYVQWFWIVPRVFRKGGKDLQVLNLHAEAMPAALGDARMSTDFIFFDSDSRTPLERVIDETERR